MISRRHMLAGVCALAAARPLRALADNQCSQPIGNRSCLAGIDIGPIETARQRCENWCWAACIQTVFALNGHNVDQQSAVQKLFGAPDVCEGASVDEIVATIDGNWIDGSGRSFHAEARELLGGQLAVQSADGSAGLGPSDLNGYSYLGARQIVDSLQNNKPLIIGTQSGEAALGHAVVLTAAEYDVVSASGNLLALDEQFTLTKIVVRDPWPDNENRRVLTVAELQGTFFVVRVSLSDG